MGNRSYNMSRNVAISKLIWWYQRMMNRTDSYVTCIPHSNRRYPHKTHSLQMKLDSSSKLKSCPKMTVTKNRLQPCRHTPSAEVKNEQSSTSTPRLCFIEWPGTSLSFTVIQIHFRSRNSKARPD